MDIYLCIPGLDLQVDDLVELNINNYMDKLLWNTPSLDYFLGIGNRRGLGLSLSDIISQYLLVEDLKYQIIRYLKLPLDGHYILGSLVSQNMNLYSMQLLYGNDILRIGDSDAYRFCDDLNLFFSGEGIGFHVYTPDLWVISTDSKFSFSNRCIFDISGVVGYDVRPLGRDSSRLLRLQTEISTFLFNHSINSIRGRDGLLKINGIWLWDDIKSRFRFKLDGTIICGDVFWIPSSLHLKHINFNNFGDIYSNLFHKDIRRVIIYTDILHRAILNMDISLHVKSLEDLERDFFVILQKYLVNMDINNLYIISNGKAGGILRVKTSINRLFKFFGSFKFRRFNRYDGRWF